MTNAPDPGATVRLDRWLWAARFYRTRAIAAEACRGNKVEVNGQRAKPAKAVSVGDELTIAAHGEVWTVTILGLSEKRLGAPLARQLYEESAESVESREREREKSRMASSLVRYDPGRPSKRDRRAMDRFRKQDTKE